MQNVCRTCLRAPANLVPLFTDRTLIKKIETISSLEIREDALLPSTICEECISNVNRLYNFRKVIINSDIELKERLQAMTNIKSEIPLIVDPEQPEVIKIKMEVESDPAQQSLAEAEVKKIKGFLGLKFKTYMCDRCNFSCMSRAEWRSHKQSKHCDPGICPICGKIMRKDNLSKHLRNHTCDFKCEQCGGNFKNYEALRSHLYMHKGQELHCEICGKTFYYHGDLNRHVKKHLYKPIQKRVTCSICNKEYEQRAMKKHLRSHTGERPYPCQYCKKGFSSSNALKTHIRQHTNEKPYICEYCPMAFPQKVSLVTHIRSKHTKRDNDDVGQC